MEQRTVVNTIPVTSDKLVESVYHFNRIGGPTPPGHFNAERVGFYIGMQLEELAETIAAVCDAAVDFRDRTQLLTLVQRMEVVGAEFKAGKFQGAVLRADREELLDGSIDSTVVSLGALIYQTPHFRQAIEEVLGCNADKFPGGVAQRDANGKIMKPQGWKAPNLLPFIDKTGLDE